MFGKKSSRHTLCAVRGPVATSGLLSYKAATRGPATTGYGLLGSPVSWSVLWQPRWLPAAIRNRRTPLQNTIWRWSEARPATWPGRAYYAYREVSSRLTP